MEYDTMPEEVLTVVRVPLAELAESVRSRNRLTGSLVDAKLEGDVLTLYYTLLDSGQTEDAGGKYEVGNLPVITIEPAAAGGQPRKRRRRAHAKRRRMKTRGWTVVARITNSRGQKSAVYKPFVEALSGKSASKVEQRTIVAEILRSNGNRPSQESIEYFLQNTLDYVRQLKDETKEPGHA
jgi:hypothetical protein